MREYGNIIRISLVTVLVASASVWGASSEACRIRIRAQAEVSNGPVALGDIAKITGAEAEFKERLEKVIVTQFTAGEKSQQLRTFDIAGALAQADIEPASLDIYGASVCELLVQNPADTIEVTETKHPLKVEEKKIREEDTIFADTERQSVEEQTTGNLGAYLKEMVAGATGLEGERLLIEWDSRDREYLQQAYDEQKFQVEPRCHLSLGRVRFGVSEVNLEAEDQEQAREDKWAKLGIKGSPTTNGNCTARTVTGTVQYLCAAVVTVQPLSAGHIITNKDVKLDLRRVSDLSDISSTNLEAVIGQRTARTLEAHTFIKPSMLRKVLLVKRNQPVEVLAQVGCIRIVLRGKALADGAEDEIIAVAREDDQGQILRGRVIGAGIVRAVNKTL